MQSEEAEEFHEDVEDVLIGLALCLDLLEGGEVGLDDHVLCVCLAEAVEIHEQVVPGFLLLVAVLAGFEGEERDAPREGGDEIFV